MNNTCHTHFFKIASLSLVALLATSFSVHSMKRKRGDIDDNCQPLFINKNKRRKYKPTKEQEEAFKKAYAELEKALTQIEPLPQGDLKETAKKQIDAVKKMLDENKLLLQIKCKDAKPLIDFEKVTQKAFINTLCSQKELKELGAVLTKSTKIFTKSFEAQKQDTFFMEFKNDFEAKILPKKLTQKELTLYKKFKKPEYMQSVMTDIVKKDTKNILLNFIKPSLKSYASMADKMNLIHTKKIMLEATKSLDPMIDKANNNEQLSDTEMSQLINQVSNLKI